QSGAGNRTPNNLADAEIIDKASNAKNGPKFRQLWAGEIHGYKSASEADQALCNYLAFWCGPDEQRIADLFSQSGLARSKWNRENYRKRTIQKALAGRQEYYDPGNHKNKSSASSNGASHREAPQGNSTEPRFPAAVPLSQLRAADLEDAWLWEGYT